MFPIGRADEGVLPTLMKWLALPTAREQRRFLEASPVLLSPQHSAVLNEYFRQATNQHEKRRALSAQTLLRDAHTRGGTAAAIREAYLNIFGGFILDLPQWLDSAGQQLAEMQRIGQPYETAAARIVFLQNVLARTQADSDCPPETRATLHHALAVAYQERLGVERAQQMEAALAACEAALQVYMLPRSPYQYARVQITLGTVYRERAVEAQRENLERAIGCCHEALGVATLEEFPDDYAQAHAGLGHTYQLRIEGERRDNLEQAIGCCHEALGVWTPEEFPVKHAQTLHVLGTAYFRRVAGERRDNLEQAIACYRQAAAIFTLGAFPVEYAQGQNYLAAAHAERVSGEQRDNLEQAISYYLHALRVYTGEAFPIEYAKVQNNLGIAYFRRIAGERRDNLEYAIACHREALRVWTLEAFPSLYATSQLNLGGVYVFRLAGERRDNLEQAIACYREVLRVWTLEAFPYLYAKVQNNLGEAYQHRLAGEQHDNEEQALNCYREALRIWTLEALPQDYAMAQRNLGAIYQQRGGGERQENLDQSFAAYQEALRVYTLYAFPNEHRQVQLACAETLALRQDWAGAHAAYIAARQAEDLLVVLGAGAIGRDAILKEGQEATVRDGYALTRLGKVEEAAVAIERGRARGLAEALQFNAADPNRISDVERRKRYLASHHAFTVAQATLQAALPRNPNEESQRQMLLERTATYRAAKVAFDAVVEEVRAAQDPADFLADIRDATTIKEAVESCGQRHALVYLAATPWGGLAVAACAAQMSTQAASQFAYLDLPFLTDSFVGTLIETRVDNSNRVTGGFDCAQRGTAFEMLQSWPGATLGEKAATLHTACLERGHTGTLDSAAQRILSITELTPLIDHPLTTLSDGARSLLLGTLSHAVLQAELHRCQALLGEVVLQPVLRWLQKAGVTSLTLVPCGLLAAFPLAGVLLSDGRTLGETLPTSCVPSARSLLRETRPDAPRTGIYTLGNPYPTQQALRWGEAEAFTLAQLGGRLGRPQGVRVQWQATRNWLIEALHIGQVVDASCHGTFERGNFLRSRLILANEEEVTLADMLSDQADLRGLRLLILSACQTAILDLQGARNEVRSLAAGMLQAGAAAVLAALWAVDDRATYLLMVRFALEWFPHLDTEPPAAALGRAQQWLRTVTNRELEAWQVGLPTIPAAARLTLEAAKEPALSEGEALPVQAGRLVAVRGRANRFDATQGQELIQTSAEEQDPDVCPYADPYFWAGFHITGW